MTQYLWDEHFEEKKNHKFRRIELEKKMTELDSYVEQAYEDKVRGLIPESLWIEKDRKWKLEKSNIQAEHNSIMDTKDE